MKKVFLLLFALLSIGMASSFAQNPNDTISVEKNRFYYKGMQIESVRQMKSIVANNQLALQEVKKAGVANGFSQVFSFIGGFAIGWEIAGLFFDRFNPYILGGGVAFAGLGIGLSVVANNHLKKGASIFNANLRTTASGIPVEFSFGFVPGGVGFALSF